MLERRGMLVMSPPGRPQCVPFRRCRRLTAKSAHRLRVDPAAGIGREATGAGMAVVGFGSPGAGDGKERTLAAADRR
jgi:hypothetical protein